MSFLSLNTKQWGLFYLFILSLLIFQYTIQTPMSLLDSTAWDSAHYTQITRYFIEHKPMAGYEPFVYRLGMPALVAFFFPDQITEGFKWLNIGFGLANLGLFGLILRKIGHSDLVFVLFFCLLILNPFSGLRFILFNPINTDIAAIFFSSFFFYWACFKFQSPFYLLVLTLCSMIGVAFREIVLVMPLAFLLGTLIYYLQTKQDKGFYWGSLLPVIMGFGVLFGIHGMVTTVTNPSYHYAFTQHALQYFIQNITDPLRYIDAILICIGPVIVILPLWLIRQKGIFNKPFHLHILVLTLYAVLILALAFIGGWHTDRFISWALFAYFGLLAVAMEKLINQWSLKYQLVFSGFFLMSSLLAFRGFLPIPDITIQDLHAVDADLIDWLCFAPFGDQLSALHTYSVSLPNPVRIQIALQFVLFALLMGLFSFFAFRSQNDHQK